MRGTGNIIENNLPLLMVEHKILNYTELAIKSGINQEKIEEFSKNKINFKTAIELSEFFGCTIDRLLKCIGGEARDYSFHIGYKSGRNGVVYFIKGDNGLVKIGRTTNLEKRQQTIQYNDKIKTELINYVSTFDTPTVEKTFHKIYENKRVYGEWFELDDTDIDMIKRL